MGGLNPLPHFFLIEAKNVANCIIERCLIIVLAFLAEVNLTYVIVNALKAASERTKMGILEVHSSEPSPFRFSNVKKTLNTIVS